MRSVKKGVGSKVGRMYVLIVPGQTGPDPGLLQMLMITSSVAQVLLFIGSCSLMFQLEPWNIKFGDGLTPSSNVLFFSPLSFLFLRKGNFFLFQSSQV